MTKTITTKAEFIDNAWSTMFYAITYWVERAGDNGDGGLILQTIEGEGIELTKDKLAEGMTKWAEDNKGNTDLYQPYRVVRNGILGEDWEVAINADAVIVDLAVQYGLFGEQVFA